MQLKATKPVELADLAGLFNRLLVHQATATVPDTRELLFELLKTSLWPEAVPDAMVVKDEPTRKIRASSIVSSFIKQPVKDRKVLDFGCGDGHCVAEAKRVGADAIGYDIKTDENWAKLEGVELTNDFARIQQKAPYDVILLYDVLDHCVDIEPVEILKSIAPLMGQETKLYLRCHPFSASHGTHGYYSLNKAYAHLFFTPEELATLGDKPEKVRVLEPLNRIDGQYRDWITAAGLSVVGKPNKIMSEPHPFFLDPFMLAELNRLHYKSPTDHETLKNMLAVNFVDYILTRTDTPIFQQV